ncbi:prepilin-type N-terminal cleavage/methylation domain-containing protein [Luteolibacter arcticus]|uniref:Prepilin-type N-terminal cleavage/methylation domain-containing protein n=1 Tax=Luteolibacter arcticus TaxID=1581411 RepID=A0ABT3GKT9_9BACT|nr:prepilin-type N-terminal cleavage/methylation domain-containing protein [Luteolibacter arcticus]MCW1924138.1 prepilin-type N-terminal cleavage/methylation domain-containing protein [Luteolibacter arcticus]
MKSRVHVQLSRRGFTLLEMTLVISVLLLLITVGLKSTSAFKTWRLAREAGDTLRNVYVAQRTYLADNPTTPVTSLTHALLLPYIQNGPAVFPTAKSLTNTNLNVFVGVSPPFLTATATTSGAVPPARYDPSGSTTDSLWDVGE